MLLWGGEACSSREAQKGSERIEHRVCVVFVFIICFGVNTYTERVD